jgi:hypothetical protein
MSTISELAEQISRLYQLEDTRLGIRYRVVDQLGGTTELEATSGQPRYVATRALNDQRFWKLQA